MKKIIYLFFIALLILSCSSNKESDFDKAATHYFSIKEMGELATVDYSISKILKIDDKGEWYKFGDRKILISVKANVKAGIDLDEMQENDIKINGNAIEVNLPAVKILSFVLPTDQVQTVVNDVNGLRHEFSQKDKMNIIKLGDQEIRREIKNTDILKDAENNAIEWVKSYYENLGFTNIKVTVKKELL